MSNYKFNEGKKELADEHIGKHKNFKKLLHDYQKTTRPLYRVRPIYKNKKIYLTLLVILLITWLIIEFTA